MALAKRQVNLEKQGLGNSIGTTQADAALSPFRREFKNSKLLEFRSCKYLA